MFTSHDMVVYVPGFMTRWCITQEQLFAFLQHPFYVFFVLPDLEENKIAFFCCIFCWKKKNRDFFFVHLFFFVIEKRRDFFFFRIGKKKKSRFWSQGQGPRGYHEVGNKKIAPPHGHGKTYRKEHQDS